MPKNAIISALVLALALALGLLWMERRPQAPAAGAISQQDEAPDRYAAVRAVFGAARDIAGLEHAAIGFCLIDGAGEVAMEFHGDTAFIPASALKTLVTATALEILGPGFRFETAVSATAPPAAGSIQGDLVIRGGGDPMLSIADLDAWATSLAAQGLSAVEGRILGDGRLFQGSLFADFWNWGDIGNGYGSPVSGLNLEHNRFTAWFRPGAAPGDPAPLAGIAPEVPGVAWALETLTGPAGSGDGVMIHGGELAAVIHLRGTVPADEEPFSAAGAVPDPERYAAHHFRLALERAGIRVEGEAEGARRLELAGSEIPEAGAELLRHRSPPLAEIVASIHAASDNHEAECLYRILGTREGRPPHLVVRDHWKARGLEFAGLRMVDGSGLARANHITPRDLALLQWHAGKGPAGDIYRDTLPRQEDGSPQGKGGAMSAVRTFAGFAGGEFCFALMINHQEGAEGVAALREALWQALAEL